MRQTKSLNGHYSRYLEINDTVEGTVNITSQFSIVSFQPTMHLV